MVYEIMSVALSLQKYDACYFIRTYFKKILEKFKIKIEYTN